MRKIIYSFIIFFVLAFVVLNRVLSYECDNISNLTDKITCYENKKNSLKQTADTLSSEINYMDTQINLTITKIEQTQEKITSTEKEINTLGSRIEGLDTSLVYLSKQLVTRIAEGYKNRSISIFNLLFDSSNTNNFLDRIKYMQTAQNNNQKILVQVQEAKLNYEEQKTLREAKIKQLDDLKKTLANQKNDLENQEKEKQDLLATTQNSETIYQDLINQARAQLAGFSKFTSNQGGSSILNNQTVCDDWGCYYNQRDNQWGNNSLNGTGYTLASDGCLVTSMAMIYTHYGHKDVNPQTINSNPNNFASYYPAYLKFTIVANGVTSSRINSAIDDELSQGHPVVVQISLGGNDYHFVVLISGSGGNYQMNDPYVPEGHNISFTSKYPISSIVTVQKVSF